MTTDTSPTPNRPARAALEATLAAAEDRRAEASLRLADAEEAYRDTNEEVIAAEVALADLARLEGPLFAPAGDPHR